MTHRSRIPRSIVLAAALALGFPMGAPTALAGITEGCKADLAYLPGFLLANDTGAPEHRKLRGEAVLAAAMDEAMRAAGTAKTEDDCGVALRDYLRTWRHGHLEVVPADFSFTAGAGKGDEASVATPLARIRWLSAKTVLLEFPTFYASAAGEIRKLMADHRRRLERTPNWIIDVRDNNGGSDSSYEPVMAAVVGDPIFSASVEFLSTPANIESTAGACDLYAPGDKDCVAAIGKLVTALRAAPPGTYVAHPGFPDPVMKVEPEEPHRMRPARVAVLTDRKCGSSCEQFVLEIRQARNVKVYGRSTYGALDYSNVRAHKLPSGKRLVLYATSRSTRLPYLPVDAAGIPPDIFMPPPADDAARAREIDTVRSLLERR